MLKLYKKEVEKKEYFYEVVEDEAGLLIQVVDLSGNFINRGRLLRITNEGKVRLMQSIPEYLGFPLNVCGKLVIE